MKLLLLHTHEYWLKPHRKNIPDAADEPEPLQAKGAVVALIHIEPNDIDNRDKRITKAVKQIKWLARKVDTRTVVLHSFAHLSTVTAEPTEAAAMLEAMDARLSGTGHTVLTSPFGYFNEFMLHVAGPSLAKVFVEL